VKIAEVYRSTSVCRPIPISIYDEFWNRCKVVDGNGFGAMIIIIILFLLLSSLLSPLFRVYSRVDSASNRNEYQESFLGVMGAGA